MVRGLVAAQFPWVVYRIIRVGWPQDKFSTFLFIVFMQTFHANVRVSSAMYIHTNKHTYACVCMSIWGSGGGFYSRIVRNCECPGIPGAAIPIA